MSLHIHPLVISLLSGGCCVEDRVPTNCISMSPIHYYVVTLLFVMQKLCSQPSVLAQEKLLCGLNLVFVEGGELRLFLCHHLGSLPLFYVFIYTYCGYCSFKYF